MSVRKDGETIGHAHLDVVHAKFESRAVTDSRDYDCKFCENGTAEKAGG